MAYAEAPALSSTECLVYDRHSSLWFLYSYGSELYTPLDGAHVLPDRDLNQFMLMTEDFDFSYMHAYLYDGGAFQRITPSMGIGINRTALLFAAPGGLGSATPSGGEPSY